MNPAGELSGNRPFQRENHGGMYMPDRVRYAETGHVAFHSKFLYNGRIACENDHVRQGLDGALLHRRG
jgi:hypothetical protein